MSKVDLALNNLQRLICYKTNKSNPIYLIYMHKKDLSLNDRQWLICHQTKPKQMKRNQNLPYMTQSHFIEGSHARIKLLYSCDTMSWIYAHICIHTCVCAPIPVCVCVYVYMYMCVCAHAHTHLHACTRTRTYTHIYMWRDELDSAWVSNFKC